MTFQDILNCLFYDDLSETAFCWVDAMPVAGQSFLEAPPLYAHIVTWNKDKPDQVLIDYIDQYGGYVKSQPRKSNEFLN